MTNLKKKLSHLTLDEQYGLCLLLMVKMASQALAERLEGDRGDWLEYLAVNVRANLVDFSIEQINELVDTPEKQRDFVRIILSSPTPEAYIKQSK